MLDLTNGDCAIPALRAAGVDGEILPWREVLHDGPVPALPPDELRAVTERFLGEGARLAGRDERLAVAVAEGEPGGAVAGRHPHPRRALAVAMGQRQH